MGEQRMRQCRRNEATVLARTDCGPDESICTSVVTALEAATDYDCLDGSASLYEVVDLDALDALFEDTSRADRDMGCVRFPVEGVEVTVSADGRITVSERPGAG